MAHDILVRLPRGASTENMLSALGITNLRWDAAREAYVGRAIASAWNAAGQSLPWKPYGEVPVYEALNLGPMGDGKTVARATLARFAAASAAESGNGDDLRAQSRHREDARTAAAVLEGLGVDPDAFAAMLPEVTGPAVGRRAAASKATLRKFARASAIEDGNAFFGSALEPAEDCESQYLPEARALVRVLVGLGIAPDAFSSGLPDPCRGFAKLVVPPADPDDEAGVTEAGEAQEDGEDAGSAAA